MKLIGVLYIIITITWYIGFIVLIIYLNRKYNIEYETDFNDKYYSKIPSLLNPCELSLLLNKKIINETFSAVIQFLIIKKYLNIKDMDNDYRIYPNYNDKKISKSQEFIINFLIKDVGNGKYVSLEEINKYCDNNKNATTFLNNYGLWKKLIIKESKKQFYIEKTEYNFIRRYRIIGITVFIINFIFHFLPAYFIPLFAYFLMYYFYKIFKRTKKANEDYYKWMAFRRYLVDNDLSNVIVLEDKQKYLLYATMLGVGDVVNRKLDNDLFISKLNNCINRAIIKSILFGNRGYYK